jgi:hypothetical protein
MVTSLRFSGGAHHRYARPFTVCAHPFIAREGPVIAHEGPVIAHAPLVIFPRVAKKNGQTLRTYNYFL